MGRGGRGTVFSSRSEIRVRANVLFIIHLQNTDWLDLTDHLFHDIRAFQRWDVTVFFGKIMVRERM